MKQGSALVKEVKYLPLPEQAYKMGLESFKTGKIGTGLRRRTGSRLHRGRDLKKRSQVSKRESLFSALAEGTAPAPAHCARKGHEHGVQTEPRAASAPRCARTLIEGVLSLAAASSVLVTVGIVGVLLV